MIMMAKLYSGKNEGLKLPDICLRGEEKTKKKKISPRKLVPTGDRTWARWMMGMHATTCSTVVDEWDRTPLQKAK